MKGTFRALWCAKTGCAVEEFEPRVFRLALPFHARLLAPLIRRLSPRFFTEDLWFLREVGDTRSWGELINEINRFHGRNIRDPGTVRRVFGIRISARRFLRLAHGVFQDGAEPDPVPEG